MPIFHVDCLPSGVDPNGEDVAAIWDYEEAAYNYCGACRERLTEHPDEGKTIVEVYCTPNQYTFVKNLLIECETVSAIEDYPCRDEVTIFAVRGDDEDMELLLPVIHYAAALCPGLQRLN